MRLVILPFALALATPLMAQQHPDQGAFITRLGNDTVSVEKFTWRGNTIDGMLLLRSPNPALLHWVVTLGPNETMTHLAVTTLTPDGQPVSPRRQWDITFRPDSVIAVRLLGDSSVTTRAAGAARVAPLLHVSQDPFGFAFGVRGALKPGLDSVPVTYWAVGSRGVFTTWARRDPGNHASIGFVANLQIHSHFDAHTDIDTLDFGATTTKVLRIRVRDADVIALSQSFSARAAQGQGLGAISPRDTMRAKIGDADVTVVYSRPSVRGRTIFGGIVPWGEVWRTGADAATTLILSKDLESGGVRLPAGTYTLFSLPQPTGSMLMVNGQTGQWGTIYDPARDVRHFPLRSVALATPAERLTIHVDNDGGAGLLRIDWDRTRYELRLTPVPAT